MWSLLAGPVLVLALPSVIPAQNLDRRDIPDCPADLEALETAVRRDYAGFRAKAEERASALAAVTDSVRAEMLAATDPSACTTALQRWAAFFGDPHLQLWEPRPQPAARVEANPGSGSRSGGAAAEDPRHPSIRFPDDSTGVLELPDFGDRYKPAIDSVIAEHRQRLLATPYLVIDVRRNGGGWTGSYEGSVLPLLYTDPIFVHGMEVWASEGNIAYMRQMLASDRAEGIKRVVRALLPQMEANLDQFVVISEDREIRFGTVPRSRGRSRSSWDGDASAPVSSSCWMHARAGR